MTSTRAADVAEVLWELKRAEKIATYTLVATRAGFSPGSNGRSVVTALKTVRRGWPHLQWWRAVNDQGTLEPDSEHVSKLRELGLEFEEADGKEELVRIVDFETHLIRWDEPESATAEAGNGQAAE